MIAFAPNAIVRVARMLPTKTIGRMIFGWIESSRPMIEVSIALDPMKGTYMKIIRPPTESPLIHGFLCRRLLVFPVKNIRI